MQFQTQIFVKVKNNGARLAKLGGYLFAASLLIVVALTVTKAADAYLNYDYLLIGASIIVGIAGRIVAKGNMWEIGLSDTDLLVDENGIGIGTEWFALNQITELDFLIEGYDGQPTLMRTRVGLRRGRPSSGAKNKIHFVEGGKRHLYQFYLPDRLTMQQLGQVFRIYYERGVSFGECNRGGPTFLFQQVQSKKDLAEMKRREGYGV